MLKDPSEKSPRQRTALTVQAALLLTLAALTVGLGLFWLHRSQERLAHIAVTRSVLHQGERLTTLFTDSSTIGLVTNITPSSWRLLSARIDSLHAALGELVFVSLAHNGETIYHRQPQLPPLPAKGDRATAVATLNIPDSEGQPRPVMVFTRDVTLDDGTIMTTELGLDAAAVELTSHATARSIRTLLWLSAAAVTVAFGCCLLLLLLLLRRDRTRQITAQREEHLAFSGVLANGIVHDFRNPMSSVRLDAQMLAREAARQGEMRPERIAELSGRIGRTVERMDQVFKEFLYLGKSGQEAMESVDLMQCVAECVETLAPRLEAARVTVETPDPPLSPLFVMAAPFALRRALLNILTNAVQFSPPGSVVTLACTTRNDITTLTIADSGPGIPLHQRECIFDLFATSRPEGTGLGLFLARTALRKCGGEVTAHTRQEGGALFRITLKATQVSPYK